MYTILFENHCARIWARIVFTLVFDLSIALKSIDRYGVNRFFPFYFQNCISSSIVVIFYCNVYNLYIVSDILLSEMLEYVSLGFKLRLCLENAW